MSQSPNWHITPFQGIVTVPNYSRSQPRQMTITTTEILKNLDSIQESLSVQFPYVNITTSNLGGVPSIFIHVSFDSKDQWNNQIYYNSRYSIFAIQGEGSVRKIEMIAKHHKLPKFRKYTLKSTDQIAQKIITWAAI